MSGLTFNGSSTQEMINNAKGEEKKIKLSKLEKLAKEKEKAKSNEKVRHSLYIDENIMFKLYTLSIKHNVSVNDMILELISDSVKNVAVDEEAVIQYKDKNKKKGKRNQ